MYYGIMVVKDEEDRYLQASLQWALGFLDKVFVYDDLSLDRTAVVAAQEGATVAYRDPTEPTFLENEGVFRNNSWKAFEERMNPDENDWILALDADDFFVGTTPSRRVSNVQRAAIEDYASAAEYIETDSVSLRFLQVWKNDNGIWLRRDGWWDKDKRPQFFRYREGGTMIRDPKRKMATGCWPTYADKDPLATMSFGTVLHYGYARDEDKQAKFDRYTSLKDHGHNKDHINSIITLPRLSEWKGNVPKVWRGTI